VLHSLDNQIDVTTGTLKFKARFDNKDQALFPNQFVNVRLLADTLKRGAGAVGGDPVRHQRHLRLRAGRRQEGQVRLKVGASDGDNTVVKKASAGDRVVLEGTDRLKAAKSKWSTTATCRPPRPAPARQAGASATGQTTDKAQKGGA
jgi:multidrug efflux system membrane fusion protein